MSLAGSCHCGAVRVFFDPARPTEELSLRACQCSFCRRHGAWTTSDPDGRLEIEAAPGASRIYRFGRREVDFILCRECGTYVAAIMDAPGGKVGVVNVVGAALPGFEGRSASAMPFGDEDPETRVSRRHAGWSPTLFVEATPNA